MKHTGMTITSVLVAVALTSALAVATAKLISNQAKLNKIMTLTDQRDMIVRFYSALMHNRLAWRCTLYDPQNSALLAYITNTTASFSGNVELRTPDCKFKENFNTTGTAKGIEELLVLTGTHGSGDHYRSSDAFFDTNNPVMLGDSLTEHNNDGWWQVRLTGSAIAKGSIDLTLAVEFDEVKYKAKHGGFDPPDIRDTVVYKVRKGDPNIQDVKSTCADNEAITAIDDLRSDRGVTCSDDFLVDVPNIKPGAKGNFLHTLADGADLSARVGSASGTEGRTGLLLSNEYPFAIHNITAQGDYRHTNVSGQRGVLGSHCMEEDTSLNTDYVLHSIAGSPGTLTYGCSYNRGPKGRQGLPGPLGHEGDRGPRGHPAPPCG